MRRRGTGEWLDALEKGRSSRLGLGHGTSSVALVGLLGYATFFYRDLLFEDRVYVFRDVYTILLAMEHLGRSLAAWHWPPLWNPLQVLGKPFAADPLAAVYYPVHWLAWTLPMPLGLNASLALHHVLAATGMFLLLRHRDLSRWAAGLGGLLFGFGGCLIALDNMFNALRAATWAPWSVLAFDIWCDRRTFSALAVFSVAFSMALLGGVPEFILFTDLLLVAVAYERHRQGTARFADCIAALTVGNLLAFGLCAVQLVPFAEYLAHSSRTAGLNVEGAVEYSLRPLGALAFLLPRRFIDIGGNFHETAALWEGSLTHAPWALTLYMGPVLILLAPAVASLTRFQRCWWGGIGLTFLVLALGKHLPGYVWVIEHVSFLRVARHPEKFLLVVHALLAVGTAIGLESALRYRQRFRSVAVGAIALALTTLLASGLATAGGSWAASVAAKDLLRLGFLLGVIGGIALLACRFAWSARYVALALVLLTASDLYGVNGRLLPSVSWSEVLRVPRSLSAMRRGQDPLRIYTDGVGRPPVRAPEQFVQERNLLLMESANYYLVANLNAPASINLVDHERLHVLIESVPDERVAPLLGAFNTAYVTGPKKLRYPGLTLIQRPRSALEAFVYRVEPLLPRAFVPERLHPVTDMRAAMDYLRDGGDPHKQVVVEAATVPPGLPAVARGAVVIESYHPDRVELSARMDTPGLVVLGDSYFPGWHAEVNGVPASIVRTNQFVRGVYVDAGDQRIVFRYAPWSYRIGVAITGITGTMLLVGMMWPLLRRLDEGRRRAASRAQ